MLDAVERMQVRFLAGGAWIEPRQFRGSGQAYRGIEISIERATNVTCGAAVMRTHAARRLVMAMLVVAISVVY
jgi:hypothetical protein